MARPARRHTVSRRMKMQPLATGVLRRVACAALPALVLGAVPAHAGITAPRPVSPRGLLVQQSDLAAGGGRAAVVMAGFRPAGRPRRWSLLARVGDTTRLGRLQRLGGSVFGPRVAVGPDGTAVAAWTTRAELRVAVAPPGLPFGRVQVVLRTRASVLLGGVGVTATGRAVVAWRRGNAGGWVVQAAVRAPGRGFGSAHTLGDSQYPPAVSVSPSGTVLVTWLTTPRMPAPGTPPSLEGNPRVLATTLAAGATRFAVPLQLAGPLGFALGSPDAAGGPGGAAVVWREMADKRIALLAPGGGAFAAGLPLRTAPFVAEHGDQLALVLLAGGRMVALWRNVRTRTAEDPTITVARVETSFRPSDGAFAPPERLSAGGRLAGVPAAVALGDRAVAAWSEHRRGGAARLRIAVRPQRGGWTAPRTLSEGTAIGAVHAAAAARRAVIAWVERDGRAPGRLYVATLAR